MSAPGFILWGLYVIFGLFVVGYVTWMRWIERQEESPPPEHPRASGEPP